MTPSRALTQQHQAEPVSARPVKMNVAEFRRVGDEHKEAAGKIKHILVEYQRVLLVLFRRDQGVQDERIGCRSYQCEEKEK